MKIKCSKCNKKFMIAENMEKYLNEKEICRDCAMSINRNLQNVNEIKSNRNPMWKHGYKY